MLNYGIDHVDNGYMINKDGKKVHIIIQYKVYATVKDDEEPFLVEYSRVFQSYEDLDKYLCPWKKTASHKKIDGYITNYNAKRVAQKKIEILID